MKLTAKLVRNLIRLMEQPVPSSEFSPNCIISRLIKEQAILVRPNRKRQTYYVLNKEHYQTALVSIDEKFRNLNDLLCILEDKEADKIKNSKLCMDSKVRSTDSFTGFLVNSYTDIHASVGGEEFIVHPQEGTFTFIYDYKSFRIPNDVLVIGIENPVCFRWIFNQDYIFKKQLRGEEKRILFVSRYPCQGEKHLIEWLQAINNRYLHYGDFDLAGINIFLTEFYPYLRGRSSFLIPEGIEDIIKKGSSKRYSDHYMKFKELTSDIPELSDLIKIVKKYARCCDQEYFIRKFVL